MRFFYKYKQFSQYLIEETTGFYEIVYLQYDIKKAENGFLWLEIEQSSYIIWTNRIGNDRKGYCNSCLSIQLCDFLKSSTSLF